MVRSSDIARCPKLSFLPSHYRDDGSCRCYGTIDEAVVNLILDEPAHREPGPGHIPEEG